MKKTPAVTVTWLGHSAFKIVSPSGRIMLIDPWLENPRAPKGARDIAPVDVILVSHGHGDHLDNTVEIARRTSASVITMHEIALYLQRSGVGSAQGMNKGGTIDIGGIRVTMVDARHSSGIETGDTVIPGGEPAGFVVRFENGFRIYHAGDTSVFGDMKLIAQLYRPQIAILPIGGFYTMDPYEAAYACSLIKPKYIIGMHYGTFPALAGTPAELRKLLPAQLKKRVVELVPGQPRKFA